MIHEGIPKIADFGSGKEINKTSSHKNGTMGAICYLDPIRYRNPLYDLKAPSDIYSLGVIFWQISSGRKPFENEKRTIDLFQGFAKGRREIPIEGTPQRFIQLYQACWHSEQKIRPTIDGVIQRLEAIEDDIGIMQINNSELFDEFPFLINYKE